MSWDWQDLGNQAVANGKDGLLTAEGMEAQHETALEEAFQEGFRTGEAAGLERALRELDPSRQAAEKAASQLSTLREELNSQNQENILALAMAVAKKVMEGEIQAKPGYVAEMVEKALSHFPLDQKIRVRLNPSDLKLFTGKTGENAPVESGGREVRWTPDDSVAQGGCIVEGPEHVVDGRLDSALERIYRTVFND